MNIPQKATEIRYFFYSQAFADGLRASFAILSPALAGSYFGFFESGLTISLGAMCVSLTDAPGPLIHRKNGMLFCSLFVFIMALVTAFARLNMVTMLFEIAAASFFFSMFNVYGNRAAAVGNAALLVMILSMDTPVSPSYAVIHALLVLAGGIYYLIFSLLLHTIRPYRIAQRMLGECIREIATYLSIKSDFYNVETNIDHDYRRLVAQQIVVNEKQDAVRELFFKTRKIVEESTNEGRRLIFTFIETVDLFEDITASYYDYNLLRQQFGQSGALELINASLKKISFDLDRVGIAIQSNTGFTPSFDYDEELKQLRAQMDLIAQKERSSTLVLRKLLVNVRKVLKDLRNILVYFNARVDKRPTLDHRMFVNHQSLDPKIMADNFTFQSSIFRHSLRVCIACVMGFIVAKLLGYGHHSYWILLTIAFIIKPAFSLTKQRNVERIIGTLAGGAIGIFILVFIPDKTIHFILMVVFMIATYSFMRIRYLVMVLCTTPYVLILFSFLGSEFKPVVEERVFDTVLGCAIAFSASYFLFPKWESDDLKI
ncbi:MAG: FUSC family membrane protein, partial [Flavisolibacter sp.]